jgi:hypothetical protein
VGSTIGRFSMDGRWAAGRCSAVAHAGRWRRSSVHEDGGGTASGWLGHTGQVASWADWAESQKIIPFGNEIGFSISNGFRNLYKEISEEF